MTNQKLAPGSRWIDGKNEISDCRGYYISSNRPGKLTVRCIESGDAYTVSSDDILALIDRANLDPVRVTARRLTHELRRNLDAIKLAIPNAHYDNILDNLKELEAVL